MIKSLREFTKQGCTDYDEQERIPWTKSHFAQVVLTCASIDWAKQVLYLPYISPISPLYLTYISPARPSTGPSRWQP